MGQRTRKVNSKDNLIYFYDGVTEELIQELLKKNNINKDECLLSLKQGDVFIKVPEEKEYNIPDDVYVWVKNSY